MHSTHYFDRNSELNMLGNWLEGRHREDISLFDAGIFQFEDLYSAVKDENKTFLQLMAENKTDGVTLSELMKAIDPDGIGGALAEAEYQDAKGTALLFQRDFLIDQLAKEGAVIPAITERLLQIQAAIDRREVKPAAANLADTLLSSLEAEEKASKIKYGKGFENLDRYAGSMKRGQLVVLAARPATGKSAAALQMAYNAYKQGRLKVLFFPLEMTTNETLERLLLQEQIVDSPAALKALRDNEKEDIKAFLDNIENSGNFLIYEGVNQFETIAQTIREQRPDLVVIDQLTQVRTAKRTKDIRERYVEITADLKHIAIEYQTTILLLTQLNRDAAEKNRPTLENLHESDATGQNADVVLMMQKRDADDGTPGAPTLENIDIYIVKNRGGASGKGIAHKFNGERYRFYPVGR